MTVRLIVSSRPIVASYAFRLIRAFVAIVAMVETQDFVSLRIRVRVNPQIQRILRTTCQFSLHLIPPAY